MKIINSKNAKLTKKQYFMLLGACIAGLTLTTPVVAYAESDEEVLFVDDEDDYTTEPIQESDIVEDNTVVNPEEPKQEEKKEEEKREEVKDPGSCVTPDNGYDPEAGKYWDPSIKTEEEKKGLVPETPETPETPEVPETPDTPSVPETPVENIVPETPVTPAPQVTPKTGDLSDDELLLIIGSLGLAGIGVAGLGHEIAKKRR